MKKFHYYENIFFSSIFSFILSFTRYVNTKGYILDRLVDY